MLLAAIRFKEFVLFFYLQLGVFSNYKQAVEGRKEADETAERKQRASAPMVYFAVALCVLGGVRIISTRN